MTLSRSAALLPDGSEAAGGRVWLPAIEFVDMAKKSPTNRQSEILTTSQAAALAGLDRSHFWRLVKAGQGPRHQTVQAGARELVLIIRGDLDAWIKERNQ